MAQSDGSIIIDTRIDESGLNNGLNSMKGAVVTGMAAITAAIGAASVAVIALGSEFEQTMAKVDTLVDANVNSIDKISSEILNLSTRTGQAATELTEATYEALSAGINGTEEEIVGFVEKSARLAKAGFTTTASAVDVMTTAINGYGLEVGDADDIANQLIVTQNLGKTTVNELASTLGRVIPTASAFSVSLGNVNTSMAIMTASGIATTESATYLKSMLNELGNTGSEVSKVLVKETGKSFSDLMNEGKSLGDIMSILGNSVDNNATAFANLWGSQEAGTGALSILNAGTEKYNDTLNKVENSTTAVDDAYDKVTDTFQEKSKKVVNSFKNVGIAAYEKFQEPLKGAMDSAQKSVDSLSREMSNGKLGESVDKIADGFASLITEATKLASKAIPLIINGFAFLVDNGGKIIPIMTGVVTAFTLYTKQATIMNVIDKATAALKTASTAATVLYATAQNVLSGSLTVAEGAQMALNVAMGANPIGIVIIAVAALAAGITALVFAMSDEDDAHKKNMENLNAELKAREDLKQKQSEQLAANLGEITNIQSLNNELKNLVDADGKVKKGYEARTSFIVNELNDALGLNMQLTDGEIKGYGELSSSINDMIAKKRAEIILESQLPAYKKAVTEATNAQIEANRLDSELSVLKTQELEKEIQLKEKYVQHGDEWREAAFRNNDTMLTELSILQNSTRQKEQEYNAQNDLVHGYYDDISSYETNAALIASGNADNYAKVQANSLIVKQDTTKGKIEASQQEIQAEKSYIEHLKGEYKKETDKARKEQLKAQIEAKEATIKTEQEKIEGMKSTIINKGPEYDAEVKRLAQNALESFKGDTQKYFGVSKDKFQKVIDGLNSKYPEVIKKAQQTAEGMLKNLRSKNDEYSKQGAYVLDGVINGVNSKSGDVFATMRDFGSNMLSSFKNALGIKSPSRMFAKLAKFVPDGISKGIDDNKGVVDDSINNLANGMLSSFNNIDLSNAFDTIKSAIYAEQTKMSMTVNTLAKEEIMRTAIMKQERVPIKASIDGTNVIQVNLDGKELAVTLAPLISKELAFM